MTRHYGRKVIYLMKDNNLDRDSIIYHLNGGDWEIIDEIIESNFRKFTGLAEALSIAKANFADLVTNDFIEISSHFRAISMMMDSNVKIIGVDLKPNFNASTNLTFLKGIRKIAEQKLLERSFKIKEGQKKARKAGKKIGNVKSTNKTKPAHLANMKRWAEFRREVWPIVKKIREATPSITDHGICVELEQRNIQTFSGKTKWYSQVLRRIINQNINEVEN